MPPGNSYCWCEHQVSLPQTATIICHGPQQGLTYTYAEIRPMHVEFNDMHRSQDVLSDEKG